MSYHKKINSLSKSFLIGFILLFVGIFNASAQHIPDANGIIYVRQGNLGDGSSWANATGDFQDAINATGVMQVWVAKGTYQPVSGQSFTMKHGVAIYGGFPTNNDHAGMDDRNWSAHVTKLQGNGNSVVTNVDNALTPADVLDGFTIIGGSGANGGGVFNSNSSPSYRNLVITQNTTAGYGGGMVITGSSSEPRLTNMLINNNSAAWYGGGVNNTGSPTVTNVTISGNTAGGGNEWHDQGSPIIRNSIIYGNGVLGQMNDIQNSLVQNQTNATYADSTHQNLSTDTDPLFADPDWDNYTLQRKSPAINKGKSALFEGLNAGTKDLAGNTRLFDVAIDMGAYESPILQPAPDANGIVYVRQGGTGNGSSWANASNDLQGAINAADVVQVWVAKGTYQPVSGQSFTMKHSVAIYGGFPDNDDHAGMDDRDWVTHLTTLQGNGNSVVANVDNALTPTDVLDGFTITGGSGTNGGGIKNINVSPSYLNLVITQNTAAEGGGMYITGLSYARLTNVLISRNSASRYGGGMNCVAWPILTNVTISGNTASLGAEWFGTSLPVIRNSIIYGNGVSEQIYDIQNSLVQDQTNANYKDVANNNLPYGTDPLFTDPAGGNYSLLRESPAINKGKSSLFDGINAGTKDLAGNRRLFDVEIDMGAYESPIFQPGPDANGIVYVREEDTGNGNGSSWTNATNRLQEAINVAGAVQVWVAEGTYQPASGKSFTMKHGVGIYGGFPKDNDHAGMDDRNWGIHLTKLQGNGNTVVTNFENALTSADVLDGFTITGGSGTYGGGVLNYYSTPSYRNLVITQNTTTSYGGGMCIIGSSLALRITNVLISNNYAGRWGGGVEIDNSSPQVTNVTISGNTDALGGAEWVHTGYPVIRNSIIYGNGVIGQMYDVQNSLVQNQTNSNYGDIANNNLPTDTDPLFTDPAGGNYSLLSTSPAINKGKNTFFDGLNAGSRDPKGNSRLIGFAIDMGAFESPDGPLPVRLISFEGRLNDQKRAVLTWKTDEINASHYEIERSSNAKDFHRAGIVTAGGNGSANYIFTDPTPVSGNGYYRIRLVDQDDTFSYSRIISLTSGKKSELFAYPNPTRDHISIELKPEYIGSIVRLINTIGVVLQQTEVKEKLATLDISNYASGIYLLQLHDGKVVKLIKE